MVRTNIEYLLSFYPECQDFFAHNSSKVCFVKGEVENKSRKKLLPTYHHHLSCGQDLHLDFLLLFSPIINMVFNASKIAN